MVVINGSQNTITIGLENISNVFPTHFSVYTLIDCNMVDTRYMIELYILSKNKTNLANERLFKTIFITKMLRNIVLTFQMLPNK